MSASLAIDVSRFHGGASQRRADKVAVEEPLEIQLAFPQAEGAAARSISITMRTPGDDAELATGFLYGESVISGANDVASVEHVGPPDDNGYRNVVRVGLAPGVDVDLERLERHFYTTSSCGVCGKSSLHALRAVGQHSLAGADTVFGRSTLASLPENLRTRQALFAATGGLHAAAAFDAGGELVVVREDVGRHNAVDKVVGALLAAGRLPAADLGLLVSGRASFELMQKALVARMPLLAAVGAPSSLAVELAREFDMTLVGFLRGSRFNVYAGEARIG